MATTDNYTLILFTSFDVTTLICRNVFAYSPTLTHLQTSVAFLSTLEEV
jgi:hypothetical protein